MQQELWQWPDSFILLQSVLIQHVFILHEFTYAQLINKGTISVKQGESLLIHDFPDIQF